MWWVRSWIWCAWQRAYSLRALQIFVLCQKLQRAGFSDQMEVDMAGAGFEVAIVPGPQGQSPINVKRVEKTEEEEEEDEVKSTTE